MAGMEVEMLCGEDDGILSYREMDEKATVITKRGKKTGKSMCEEIRRLPQAREPQECIAGSSSIS